MKKFLLVLSIFISVFLFSISAFADSPITSTHFSDAYMDISIVKQAGQKGVVDAEIVAYLSDAKNPIDVKAAVINALSWDVDGKKNAEKYSQAVYKTSVSKLKIDSLSGDQLFCIGYMMAMDDYLNTNTALNYLKLSEKKTNNSFTVSAIRAIVEAQNGSGGIWKYIQTVQQNSTLKRDMREDAENIILDYLACEGIQISQNNMFIENGKSQKVYLYGAISFDGEIPYQIVKQSDKAYTSLSKDKYGIYCIDITGVVNGSSSIEIKNNEDGKVKINFSVISSDTYSKLNNTIFMYAGSTKALKGKSEVTVNAAPYLKNNNQFIPIEIFSKITRAKIQYDKKKETCTITYSGNTITAKSGKNQVSINGKSQKFLSNIEKNNNQLFISAKDFGAITRNEYLYYNGLILFTDKVSQFDTVTNDYILNEITSLISDGKSALNYPTVFKENDKYGYKDASGKVIIKPTYLEAYDFREGAAVVAIQKSGVKKYGFIDVKGNFIFRPVYDWASYYVGGLAPVGVDGNWGFIDRKGNKKNPFNFGGVGSICNGLSPAQASGGEKWGFIDADGNLVIPYTYDDCNCFSEGLAAVKVGAKWGFINKKGEMVIQPSFDEPGDFVNGIATVKVKDEYHDYNKSGKNVSFFDNGDIYVGEVNKGVLEGKGVYTWADGSQYIGDFKNGSQEGEGVYTATDGTVQDGHWENGEYKGTTSGK